MRKEFVMRVLAKEAPVAELCRRFPTSAKDRLQVAGAL